MRPLYQRWPALETLVPCEELAQLPTPVHSLSAIDSRLWVKHDNATHPVYGGNKIRKLEFIIPELKRQQIRQVISLGGSGTNSGTALAMVCRELGIRCRLYVFEQADSDTVRHNRVLMERFGAERIPVASSVMAGLRYYLDWRRLDRSNYFLYAGCSNAVSVFAYVNALLELKQQVEAGLCPRPARILVATGSCSTLAGLLLGKALLDWEVRITGVRVAPDYVGFVPGCTPGLVDGLMRAALEIMVQACPDYRHLSWPEPELNGDYYGAGYGIASVASERARQRAQQAGLLLENTYTAKAFAATLDALEAESGPVLFWNTHAG